MEIPAHDDIFEKLKTIKEKFYLTWQVIWGLPKSLLFNVHYFGLKRL